MGAADIAVLGLADTFEVVVRTIGPDDASLLQAFVRRLSARSRRFRFFVALAELSAAQLDRFVNVDPARGFALVALNRRQEGAAIVADARYALAQQDASAEFAIAVAAMRLGFRLRCSLEDHSVVIASSGAPAGLVATGGPALSPVGRSVNPH
jgi:acetyltransferase